MMRAVRIISISILIVISSVVIVSPAGAQEQAEHLVVYSGRAETLIGPILEQFTLDTGVVVEVRYGGTAEMAATILEEGANSPADVFIAQDAGALGALAKAGRLATLPADVLERTPEAFRSPAGQWIGLSGRARVLVYNTERVAEDDLPESILALTGVEWAGRIGWAPTNASFQANVSAMRVLLGDDATANWLRAMIGNDTQIYANNTSIVQAVIDGEIDAGLVNHYYLFGFRADDPTVSAELHFFPGGDAGSLINVAGVGVVDTSDHPGLAQRLILYLLGKDAQTYFATETFEYPLVAGVPLAEGLQPLDEIEAPDIDLSDLDDLQGTLDLLSDTGALP